MKKILMLLLSHLTGRPTQPRQDPHPDKSLYFGQHYFAEHDQAQSGQKWGIYVTASARSARGNSTAHVFWVSDRAQAITMVDEFDKRANAELAAKSKAAVKRKSSVQSCADGACGSCDYCAGR